MHPRWIQIRRPFPQHPTAREEAAAAPAHSRRVLACVYPPTVGPYKMFFYLFLCVQESIIPLLPPAHSHYPHYCNTIARLVRNI